MKIRAVMYGTSDKSEGSWKEALNVRELVSERYLSSGVHCLPSLSLPPSLANPHPSKKESPAALSEEGAAFNKTGKQKSSKRLARVCMVEAGNRMRSGR